MRGASIVAIGVAMAPFSASAQDVAATQMALNHGDFAPRSADEISFVHRFGTCLATRQHPDALSLLPRSDKSKDELFGVATMSSGCGTWKDQVRYSPMYFRGPITEYYLEVLRSGKKLPKAAALEIYTEPNGNEAANLKPEVRGAVALIDVGSCVDKSQHEATMKVFDTQVGSSEEGLALADLTGALSECIPPGLQLAFSKFILRGYLAEGAFRNAVSSVSTDRRPE